MGELLRALDEGARARLGTGTDEQMLRDFGGQLSARARWVPRPV